MLDILILLRLFLCDMNFFFVHGPALYSFLIQSSLIVWAYQERGTAIVWIVGPSRAADEDVVETIESTTYSCLLCRYTKKRK